MALLSALASFIYVVLLLLISAFTFLWIIGKLKEIRLHNTQYLQHPHETQFVPNSDPSPSHIPLEPRRLSFSSYGTPNTPASNSNPRRRVTFSLTPEQQANELLKTAVRRRESLPSSNLLIPHHANQTQFDPTPQHVAHLFPLNDPPARSVYGSFPEQPIPAPPRQRSRFRAPDSFSPALTKRKTSPNKIQASHPKRRRNPKTATTHPESRPVYAADLFREPDQSKERNSKTQNLELNRTTPYEEVARKVDQRIVNRLPTEQTLPAESQLFNTAAQEEPGQKRSHTPPSGRKPPKPPRRADASNGFDRQLRFSFPPAGDSGMNQNGFMSGSVR